MAGEAAEFAFERAIEAGDASSDAPGALACHARLLGRYDISRDLYVGKSEPA
jgi:hypothetical protein